MSGTPPWSLWDDPSVHDAWQDRENALEAEEARDRAIEKAERGADPLWLAEALDAVKAVAYAQQTLTSEDVAAVIERTTPEPRALGAVMRMAQDKGWVIATEAWTPARNPIAHCRPMRVWRSLIHVQEAAA